jgi:hypothetical protein
MAYGTPLSSCLQMIRRWTHETSVRLTASELAHDKRRTRSGLSHEDQLDERPSSGLSNPLHKLLRHPKCCLFASLTTPTHSLGSRGSPKTFPSHGRKPAPNHIHAPIPIPPLPRPHPRLPALFLGALGRTMQANDQCRQRTCWEVHGGAAHAANRS